MADPDSIPSNTQQSESDSIPDTDSVLHHAPLPVTSFAQLKLSPAVLASVAAAGFATPTPIQAQFIPLALTGSDVMGQARTGTGKTAAFLLPAFERLKPGLGVSQVLILAPTRELALQIDGEVTRLGGPLGFRSVTVYGGSSYEPQIKALKSGVDILVGTPGRIMDHMRSGRLQLNTIKLAVLDEADRMLDLGFRKDIEYILRHCPARRQTLLLSATIPDDIRKLAQRFMVEPLGVWTSPEKMTVDAVEQYYVACERDEKLKHVLKILDVEKPSLAIIFCGTKMGAKRLAERLNRVYINAREIHGDLEQNKREKIMGHFRAGKVRLLIATDVASRGIDVQNITHIINYDVPYKIEDYVHRIGRTGRMEKAGKAITLITPNEARFLTDIEILINRELTPLRFPDLTSMWWPDPPRHPPEDYVAPPREHGEEAHAAGPSHRHRRDFGRPNRVVQSGADAAAADVQQQVSDQAEALAASEAAPGTAGTSPARSGGRRPHHQRVQVNVTCAQCGAAAVISFQPRKDRPVYCDVCYQARKSVPVADTVEAQVLADTGETEVQV